MDWATIIIWAIGFGMINYAIAVRKNRDKSLWAIIGALFGVFGVIMLLIMPKIEK